MNDFQNASAPQLEFASMKFATLFEINNSYFVKYKISKITSNYISQILPLMNEYKIRAPKFIICNADDFPYKCNLGNIGLGLRIQKSIQILNISKSILNLAIKTRPARTNLKIVGGEEFLSVLPQQIKTIDWSLITAKFPCTVISFF